MLDLVTLGAIAGNVGSVVGVVILNKYIVSIDAFNFMVFLSFTHFVFTYLGCCLLLRCGFFTYKPAPLRAVLPVALVRACVHQAATGTYTSYLYVSPPTTAANPQPPAPPQKNRARWARWPS